MTAKSTKKRKRIGSASENSQNDFAVQNVKLTTAKRSMTPMQTQSQSATKIAILKSAKKAKPKPSALAVASKPKLKARATKKIIKRKVTKDAGKEKDISSALGCVGEVLGYVPGLGSDDEGDDGDEERDTRKLIMEHNRKKKKSGGFQSMGLSPNVFNGLLRKGYKIPTPIQRKTIPLLLDGRDVVAMARTGSGKTAAFLLPLLERLRGRAGGGGAGGARALILSPTRELALQTLKFTKELGRFTGLKPAVILGGDRMEEQFAAIHEGPDILIATPGRFMHVLVEMELKLNRIEYVVFDEADRLFELGFSEQLQEILRRLPATRQAALFSATLPKQLVEFASAGLHEPILVRLDVDTKLSENLQTAFLECRAEDKTSVLLHLLTTVIGPKEQTLIFVATKHHVEYLQQLLAAAGIACSHSYSSLDPTARKIQVAKFRAKKTAVLLVTDLAARGIDIPLLDNVINYNFPAKPKLFVHRVGRVARAGSSGTAFSLVVPEEVPFVLDLHLFLGRAMNLVILGKPNTGGPDGLYGRVPQWTIDAEGDRLRVWHQRTDIASAKKVAANGYKHYLQSRPAPSAESVKRVKRMADLQIGHHPLFKEDEINVLEGARGNLLDAMKTYRPQTTIFEVNSTSRTKAMAVMAGKRRHHGDVISRNALRLQHAAVARETAAASAAAMTTAGCPEASSEYDVQVAFSSIIAPKRPAMDRLFETKRRRKETAENVDEHFVSYQSKDFQSEKGLSMSTGKSFERELTNATLDLAGDDSTAIRKTNNQMKWDRKRKRFVHESGNNEGKKRVQTESGAWISGSYKSNLYKEWLSKSNVVEFNDEDEDQTKAPAGGWRGKRKGYRNSQRAHESSPKDQDGGGGGGGGGGGQRNRGERKGRGKPQGGGGKGRSEMRSVDEILKGRRVKTKKQTLQKRREQIRSKRSKAGGGKRK